MSPKSILPIALLVSAAGCIGGIEPTSTALDPDPNHPGGDPSSPGSPSSPASGECRDEAPGPRLLRQLTRTEYENTVADLLAITEPNINEIPPDNLYRGFDNNVAVSIVTDNQIDAYALVAERLTTRAINESYAMVVPCTTEDSACQGQFLDTFGLRAFRRPLTDEEKGRYAHLFDASLTGGNFKVGIQLAMRSLLLSPNFLFRSELGVDDGKGHFQLTPFEVASALSYTYWGTMPDAELFDAARTGKLSNRSGIEAQARRLLQAPRGRAQIANFFDQWMEAPKADYATKDPGAFPALFKGTTPDEIRQAMAAEQDAFVSHVVFDGTRKFDELFTARYTFAGDLLARFYGLPAPGSMGAVKQVALPDTSARGGLLTMGTFLFGHARTTASSPTQRGHLVREGLLCEDVPPPPPGVDPTIPEGTPGKTARAQITFVTSASMVCKSCHSLMDPIGFGLENFDGAGAFRTMDNGEAIDASGEIQELNGPGTEPATFNGPRELSKLIGGAAQARACLATNYFRFGRGFDAKGVDRCAAERLEQQMVKGDIELPELFVQLALQDSFVTRRSAEVVEK